MVMSKRSAGLWKRTVRLGTVVALVFGLVVVFTGTPPAWGHDPEAATTPSTQSHLVPCGGVQGPAGGPPAQPKALLEDVLTGFEMRPFVFVADEMSTSVLMMSTAMPEVEEIRIAATEIDQYFGDGTIILRDDGLPPDESPGDLTFSGSVQMQTLPATLPSSKAIRTITFDFSMADKSTLQITEDVGYSIGYMATRLNVPVVELEGGIAFTSHVVNLVDEVLLERKYPDGMILREDASTRLYSELFDDRYDWLIFFHVLNRRGFPGGSYTTVRNAIEGIGKPLWDEGENWGSEAQLRGVIDLNWKHADVLNHEIFHTWGVYGFDKFGMQSSFLGAGHWGPFAHPLSTSVFGANYTLGDLRENLDNTFSGCKSFQDAVLPIELYLMGLVPATDIGAYQFVIDSTYLASGIDLSCPSYYRNSFAGLGLDGLDASRILAEFGPRNPPYPDDASFNAAAVVVSDRPLEPEEWDYIDQLFAAHPAEFLDDYRGMATITYRLMISPVVETLLATDVSAATATLNGSVNPRGLPTAVRFVYGQGGTLDNEVIVGEFSDTTEIAVSAEVTGLDPESTYEFRIAAQNDVAGGAGGILQFTTDAAADADSDGVFDHVDICPGTDIPEAAPTQQIGRNRWALMDNDTVFDTYGFEITKPVKNPYTTEDTMGCSCEQIVREMKASRINLRLGCATKLMEDWILLLGQ